MRPSALGSPDGTSPPAKNPAIFDVPKTVTPPLTAGLGSYLDHYDSKQEIEIGQRVVELEAATP